MSVIKEFREFYLRVVQVPFGIKADNEVNFPTDYQIGNQTVKNRFLRNNFPSENVFRKLFESITFKLNSEDTAKENEQGLAKKASNTQAKNGNNGNDGFTRLVTPSQLPTVEQTINDSIGGYDIVSISANPDNIIDVTEVGNTNRNQYKIKVVGDLFYWIRDTVNKIKVYIDTINIKEGVVTYDTIPANQNKVKITVTNSTNAKTKEFKADVVLPPYPTIDIDAITNQVIQQLTTTNSLNPLDSLPKGFTTLIEDNAYLNLHFDLVTGLGKPTSPYKKWGIVGIANGTININGNSLRFIDTGGTLAGIKTPGNPIGNDNAVLSINNIPPHRHAYGDMYVQENINNPNDFINAMRREFDSDVNVSHPDGEKGVIDEGSSADKGVYINFANTGDGTKNINNQGKLLTSPQSFSVMNKATTFALAKKLQD